jgi:hypothetical protein
LRWWLDNGGAQFIRDLVENLSDAELRTMGFEVVPPEPAKLEVGGWARVIGRTSYGSCVPGGVYRIAALYPEGGVRVFDPGPSHRGETWYFTGKNVEPAFPPRGEK